MRIYTIILISLLFSPFCRAGDSISAEQKKINELKIITLRLPDREQINAYLEDKDFQYGNEYKPTSEGGFLNRLWRTILKFIAQVFHVAKYIPVFLWVLFIVIFLAVLFIIATKTKLYRLFYEDHEPSKPEIVQIDPMHDEFDFEKAISTEVSLRNYRGAIRLLHLQVLKELDELKIIHLSKDKTNYNYSMEIRDVMLSKEFTELAGVYNQIWYGKHPVSDSEYTLLALRFNQIYNMMNISNE